MILSGHAVSNCNNLDHLRRATDKRKPEVAASVKPAVDLLHSVIKRKGVLLRFMMLLQRKK
jgi:hypothetical protein